MTHIALSADARIGVVGSHTSTGALTVDLVGPARSRALNGRLVVIAPKDSDDVQEYALGTVTEITTTNIYHENTALRGVISQQGRIGNLTERGDIKTAQVDVQAAFRANGDRLRPIGGTLSFAPSTGENIYEATTSVIQTLCQQATDDLFYMGRVYRQNILLPMSFHDFSDSRGAESAGFFGPSGAGKTFAATTFVGSQMRHGNMAFLLIDPQGQFTTNSKVRRDLPFDLRALAEAQGRTVEQLSVARGVRLPEDVSLFTGLLASAGFFGANRLIGANNQAGNARDVVEGWLDNTSGWAKMTTEALLDGMLAFLIDRVAGDAVVVSRAPKERMVTNLTAALDNNDEAGRERRRSLMRVLEPFHGMFREQNPDGTHRKSMKEIVHALCNADTGIAGRRKGRPFFVLTLADQIGAGERGEETEVTKALKETKTQMVILRALFTALEGEARWQYQSDDGTPANLMVIMDEAARFTSTSHKDPEQQAMAAEIARYFRELRKYAIGFTLILQEPSALHDSIWKQLQNGFRAFAGGLVGNDLERVREQVGGGALRLYQQLAKPSKDNAVYPWMFCGSISPLSVTSSPLFMEAFTAPQDWAEANAAWLPGIFNAKDIWSGH